MDVQHTCSSRSALRNRAFLASSYFASVLLALAHSSRNSSSFQMRMYPSSWGCGGDDASLTRHFGSRSHFHTLGPTLLSFSTREPHAISGATSTPAARHGRARHVERRTNRILTRAAANEAQNLSHVHKTALDAPPRSHRRAGDDRVGSRRLDSRLAEVGPPEPPPHF